MSNRPQVTHPDFRPEDRLSEGAGRLIRNRHRLRNTDPDLVGALRIDGRIVQVRGWVLDSGDTAYVRLEAR